MGQEHYPLKTPFDAPCYLKNANTIFKITIFLTIIMVQYDTLLRATTIVHIGALVLYTHNNRLRVCSRVASSCNKRRVARKFET